MSPSRGVFLLLFLCTCTLRVSFGQNQEPKKDIPAISREALRAIVLVVVSDSDGKAIKQGSGIVASSDGKIITNYHVIEGGASAVVKFSNGAFFLIEGIVAVDKGKDIAVLKADGSDFPVVPLGDSDKVQVGEEVVSIGSPLSLEDTVSNGIISSIRDFKDENVRMFQTTAPISPGSSGGALLNMNGEVVGITTAQLTNGQNLNFAIPINEAKSLLASRTLAKMDAVTNRIENQHTSENRDTSLGDSSGIWTSLTSGHDFKIKIDDDHMYIEWIFPPAAQQYADQGAFTRCDLARQDSKWVGTCNSNLPYQSFNKWTGTHVTWCRLSAREEITLFTPTRIEGESETYEAKDFEAEKCLVKKTEMKPFVWIPKN